MYGKYCADYRGYGNVNSSLGAIFESIGGNAYPFRVSEEGQKLRKNVQEWCIEEVNSAPQRKMRLLYNQEIIVQYTRLGIFLPEENDEDDTENDVINSAELVQRVSV